MNYNTIKNFVLVFLVGGSLACIVVGALVAIIGALATAIK